jgi:hypothetical protein
MRKHIDAREDDRGKTTLTTAVLRNLKDLTWYYGTRCGCGRMLPICEDCFAGKGNEMRLDVPWTVRVTCDCGKIIRTRQLYRFKTDGLMSIKQPTGRYVAGLS